MSETFGTQPVGSPVLTCPRAEETQTVTWIAIQLIGEDDQPIPWEEYRITLPNGDTVRGFLDGQGSARVENIRPAGLSKITFPRLDQEAWNFLDSE